MSSHATLLAALDTAPYAHRGELLATWGSAAEVDAARAALAASDEPWHRQVAVILAARRHDAGALLAALGDPARQVRRVACRHAVRHVADDAALVDTLRAVDPATRRRLLQHVARAGRDPVARRVAPHLLASGEHRALLVVVHLLAFDQVEAVADVVGPWTMPWKRLALAHPDEVAAHLRHALASTALPSEKNRWWTVFREAITVLPTATLHALFADHPPTRSDLLLPVLGPLLLAAPALALQLLLTVHDTAWTRSLGHRRARHLRTLSDDALARLAVHLADDEVALTGLLSSLAPSRRRTVFEAVLRSFPDRMWTTSLLDLLPHEQRHAQARRHLARMVDEPDGPARIAPWLPLDDAAGILVPEGRPRQRDGDDRARTWSRWLDTIARERRGFGALLAQVAYLRNEQDPVRLQVIDGLSRLPVRLVRPEHVDALDRLCTAILEARDTSWATRRALQRFTVRLLVQHAVVPADPRFGFALGLLERSRQHGQALDLPPLDKQLKRGAEGAVCDAVLTHLRHAADREQGRDVVALARALGDRAWNLTELQALLGEVALTDKESSVRAGAIAAWIADPTSRDERVERVLAHDESAVTLPSVWDHLAGWRTDRLDPFLQGRRLRGRWGSSKAGWVPPSTTTAHRWLPRQQRALGSLLVDVARDKGHTLYARAATLSRLGRLPATTVDELSAWFDADVQLAEAAMGACATLDQPAAALPLLLDHLDGDRARVAAYVLPAIARQVPASVLQEHLVALLARDRLKVTVHKEVVRLLGQHRLPRSSELLAEQWARPQHRDVRIALLHSVTAFLDQDWAWSLLEHAAREADPELPRVLAGLTPWTLPPAHHARMLGVLGHLAAHPDTKVRQALFAHLARDAGGLGRADLALSVSLAADGLLDVPAVAAAAAVALVVLGSLHEPAATQRAVERLRTAADAEPIVPVGDHPDRPHLRTLQSLLQAAATRAGLARPRFTPLARALAQTLARHGDTYPQRMALLLAVHPGDDRALPPFVEEAPHPVDLMLVEGAIAQAVGDRRRPFALEQLLAWCDGLAEVPDGAMVQLCLVSCAADRYGWGPELRRRLALLRGHPVVGRQATAIVVA